MTPPTVPEAGPQPVERPDPKAMLLRLTDVLYGGYTRPADDPGRLDAIADYLDAVDDVTDDFLANLGSEHRINRGIQADLRRIASNLKEHSR